MLRRFLTLLALLAFGSVNAHAATTMRAFPSLAKRLIEDQERIEREGVPAESPVSEPVVDPQLPTDAATLVTQGHRGITAFNRDASAVQRAVTRARGSSVSSEAWVQAQVQLSALDSARYDSVAALAGLDTLYVSTMTNGAPVGTAFERERDSLASAVDGQNDALDAMRRSLAQP